MNPSKKENEINKKHENHGMEFYTGRCKIGVLIVGALGATKAIKCEKLIVHLGHYFVKN
jgi:hypothetical protein